MNLYQLPDGTYMEVSGDLLQNLINDGATIVSDTDTAYTNYQSNIEAQYQIQLEATQEKEARRSTDIIFDPSLNMPSGVTTTFFDKVSIVVTSTANASTEHTYSFASVFLAPPLVFVSVMGDDNEAQEVRAAVKNVTEGGCTVCVTRVSGHNNGATESVIVSLMAVGVIYALPL